MNNERLRHFHSLRDFFGAIGALLEGLKLRRKAGDAAQIPRALSEKIMLAVTGVNQCAYCSFLHTQTALIAGVGKEEAERILAGTFSQTKEDERPALLYAQHWTDAGGNVSADAKKSLVDFYGPERAATVESYIRIVYLGNMCSNTAVFFEDKNIPRSKKAGLFLVYLVCKPIASSILGRGLKLAEKSGGRA
jgi:AhpD family alkylhydroperoxidase